MLDWFKRFGLALFSHKYAKDGVKNGFGTVLLTSFLSIVIMFVGIFGAQTLSFGSFYKGSDEFRKFVGNVFEQGISVEITNNEAQILFNGEYVVIDTLANESDNQKYSAEGYQLFVDSRKVSETYDDFYAYCKSNKDNVEISYEQYLDLPSSEKDDYKFAVKYSGKQKIITEQNIDEYKSFLSNVDDEKIRSRYKSLQEKVDTLTAAEYNKNLYVLFVTAYYPEMSRAAGEQVPTLFGYYYQAAMQSNGKYLCLFKDTAVASFTSRGNVVSFGGIYKDGNNFMPNGSRSADDFVKSLYYDSISTLFIVELFDCVLLIAIVELIIVAVMLVAFVTCKVKKIELGYTFGKSVKLVAAYAHMAALLSAVFIICLGFLAVGQILKILAYVSFAVTLLVRTAVLLVKENKTGEKHVEEDLIDEETEQQ